MKEEIKFYIERADKFIKNAKFNYENKDYDLAMFHIEQAMQLRNLERAYITSRYFFEEFFKEEVEKSFEAFDKLKKILWKE